MSAVAVALILVTSLPYIFGYMSTPSSRMYLGVSHFLPGDYYSYLSWITQAQGGAFFLRDLYAPEYQGGFLFHPLFLLLGFFSKFFTLSVVVAYHVARVFLIGVFCFLAYALYSLVTKNPLERRIALLLLVSSSGFGFFLGKFSADLSMPEIGIFFSSYLSVLNMASLSLILLLAILTLRYFHERHWLMIIISAGILSILSLIHTYDVILFGGILFAYSLVRLTIYKESEFLMNVLWVFVLTLPSLIWQSIVLVHDESLSVWYFVQMSTFSPSLLSYISGLGILLFSALVGMRIVARSFSKEVLFFFVWLVIVFLILYNPFLPALQRKFIEGIQIPLAFFSSIAFLYLFNKGGTMKLVAVFLIGISLLTNVQIILEDMFIYLPNEKPRSISLDEAHALEWIKKNIGANDVILSEVFMGTIIPAFTARPVYMGHNDQTLNFEMKNHLLGYAFSLGPTAPRLWSKLLHDGHIRYVVEDSQVREIGGGVAGVHGLIPVFRSDTVVIYEVFP